MIIQIRTPTVNNITIIVSFNTGAYKAQLIKTEKTALALRARGAISCFAQTVFKDHT